MYVTPQELILHIYNITFFQLFQQNDAQHLYEETSEAPIYTLQGHGLTQPNAPGSPPDLKKGAAAPFYLRLLLS